MKFRHILVVYTKQANKGVEKTLSTVKSVLSSAAVPHTFVDRNKLRKSDFKNADLVVPIGGDGTFLKAAHFVTDKTLLFGVNADPSCKEGFFMSATAKDFERKFKRLIKGNFKVKKLHRLQAKIGTKKIPELALNEFYVASEKAYLTMRYNLIVKGKKERQKSSGVLVGTASGSYAWLRSAGGRNMPLLSDKFQYVVREPYRGRIAAKCSLKNQVLSRKDQVQIELEIGTGMLIVDSLSKEYRFKKGQKVTITGAGKPIHVVSFSR